MWPHDGLTPTFRNLVFLVTTGTIWACLLYNWLDLEKHVREESLYLSFFIVSTIFFSFLLGLILYDSWTNRDIKIKNIKKKIKENEINRFRNSSKFSANELEALQGKNLFSHLNYYDNSFETKGDIWRTITVAIIALTIFTSFLVVYFKHTNEEKESASYIILILVASLAMLIHIIMLLFQLMHLYKINTVKSNSIKNLNSVRY